MGGSVPRRWERMLIRRRSYQEFRLLSCESVIWGMPSWDGLISVQDPCRLHDPTKWRQETTRDNRVINSQQTFTGKHMNKSS